MRRGLFVLALTACHSSAPDVKHPVLSHAPESWCPEGFEAGPSDTCFAIPEQATKSTPVLVYLHGVYRGRGSPEEWAAVSVAVKRGFAVVLPRGKRGLCAWSTDAKDDYCWPSDLDDVDTMKSIVAEWDRVLWQVDALLEGGTHKRYLLGSANGGSFASFLATHALFPGQAFAVVNAGPLGPPAKTKTVPILLAGPDPKTKELHETLGKAMWPHAFCARGSDALSPDDVARAPPQLP